MQYQFEYQKEPLQKDEEVLFNGINDDAVIKKNMSKIQSFGIFIKDSHGIVFGGITGNTLFGNLYIDMLWINEKLRDQGLGKKLMLEAEKIGYERQCTFATVHTMDWQALTFYQKQGYEIEFIQEGYENNSKMYYLRKNLQV